MDCFSGTCHVWNVAACHFRLIATLQLICDGPALFEWSGELVGLPLSAAEGQGFHVGSGTHIVVISQTSPKTNTCCTQSDVGLCAGVTNFALPCPPGRWPLLAVDHSLKNVRHLAVISSATWKPATTMVLCHPTGMKRAGHRMFYSVF